MLDANSVASGATLEQLALPLLRMLSLAGQCLYFGCLFFFAFLSARALEENLALKSFLRRIFCFLFIFAAASLLIYALLAAADMGESWRAKTLALIFRETKFGRGVLLELALLGCAQAARSRKAIALTASLFFPFLLANLGHAGARAENAILWTAVDGLHIAAASIWSGGLFSLILLTSFFILQSESPPWTGFRATLDRFALAAAWTTGGLVGTGIATAYGLSVRWNHLFTTDYGLILIAKSGCLCAALVCAGISRFRHMRAQAFTSDRLETKWGARLRKSLRVEFLFIALALALAALLSSQEHPHESSTPTAGDHQ